MSRTSRALTLLAVVALLVLAACSSASDSSAPATTTTAVATTTALDPATAARWAELDQQMTAMGPNISFLAARVSSTGECEPVHEVEPSTSRPLGSQFKLFILGALADQIDDGTISWDDTITVDAEDQSFGNGEGSLQHVAPGTSVTVEDAATKMISISDNTAADLLLELVGREQVEAKAAEWMGDASRNVPFLSTKQMFELHYVEGLGDRYLATPQDERADFLSSEVDPLPITSIYPGLVLQPRFIDTIEWFGPATDICAAFAGLQEQEAEPGLAPLDAILSEEDAGIDLDRSEWPTVWYKGGSEPGVLTLGWLATDAEGDTFVVEAMVSDPDVPLGDEVITDLRDLSGEAFDLLGSR